LDITNVDENWLSNAIIASKLDRTLNSVCFKIRQPKPKFHSADDNENKKFSNYQKRE